MRDSMLFDKLDAIIKLTEKSQVYSLIRHHLNESMDIGKEILDEYNSREAYFSEDEEDLIKKFFSLEYNSAVDNAKQSIYFAQLSEDSRFQEIESAIILIQRAKSDAEISKKVFEITDDNDVFCGNISYKEAFYDIKTLEECIDLIAENPDVCSHIIPSYQQMRELAKKEDYETAAVLKSAVDNWIKRQDKIDSGK